MIEEKTKKLDAVKFLKIFEVDKDIQKEQKELDKKDDPMDYLSMYSLM